MVNQETSLESLILDIFEEQEDSFYFPVRSQRDARAFVKAIHLKGVPYDKIYDSIGEFEHNFSCWRNGLGRPGIGNRIIELINQPLIDLLEEDDFYPVNGSHANGLHENNKLESQRSWEDNHRVPPTHQTAKDETDSGQKLASTTTSSHRNNPPASAPESANQKSPLPARSELRRVEQNQNDKPAEQKEEAPRRMVELRRTPPRQEKKERPVSEIEKMKKQILSKKSESDETKAKDAQKEKKLERSSSSESSESESGSSSSSSSSSSESDTKVETVLGKFDAIKITESPVEEAPPKKPDRLFLDEKKEQEEKNRKELEEEKKKKELEEEKKRKELEEEKKREEMKRKIMRDHEEKREEMRKEDQRNEELKREERKEQLKRIKERYNQAPPAGTTVEDVDENYNSDLDPENTNQSPVMATLVKKISAMRAASKNSTGYVYVFSDSAQGSTKVRVKVGSSRCPNKRLQQAKCFNPDMYLVATYPVSQRVSALNDIQASLTRAKLDGASDWFTGELDNLLDVVQNNANMYPSKTIHDATTGQSES